MRRSAGASVEATRERTPDVGLEVFEEGIGGYLEEDVGREAAWD